MFRSRLYLKAAEDLRPNKDQWQAYESKGHCVVLAGPGSGKTKTLTIKLARILAEDVHAPRGIACITYNNECARELEGRLEQLGVEPGHAVFIGTVHSFSLTQIVIPYAKTAQLGLPDQFRVATQAEQRRSLERAFNRTIGGSENPQNWWFRMGVYRRSVLDRKSREWGERDPELAKLIEAYEEELRTAGLIDFDDMPLIALRALQENPWIRAAIRAKYPVLAVDEYQDLGHALHSMVMLLCFDTGIRLFAVGDVDQSVYGFNGAHPELLISVSKRADVETVRLKFNYRSGYKIVSASEYALGEKRGYQAAEGAQEGLIEFHPLTGTYKAHAGYLFDEVLPKLFERMPELHLGQVAVLYPAAWMGDEVAEAAQAREYGIIRSDANSLYPRSSRLMRWLELCALWCCSGWRTGNPKFEKIFGEGCRLFSESLISENDKRLFQRKLITLLSSQREGTIKMVVWLKAIKDGLIISHLEGSRTLRDERILLDGYLKRLEGDAGLGSLSMAQFAGDGDGNDRLNLSTLHSAKGREFAAVILFGMDRGRIPRNNATALELRESRRVFYVGFTRPKQELHILHTANNASPYVAEVLERLNDEDREVDF